MLQCVFVRMLCELQALLLQQFVVKSRSGGKARLQMERLGPGGCTDRSGAVCVHFLSVRSCVCEYAHGGDSTCACRYARIPGDWPILMGVHACGETVPVHVGVHMCGETVPVSVGVHV